MGRIAGVAATDGRDATVRSMLGAAGCTAATVIDGMAATADAGLAEAGPHVLAWDGRLYNPEEFPAPPEGGSEAARVLAAILRLGPDAALARLNADFALALLDRRDGRLLLARDRFAIRPLYHARAGLAPAFASRPASLLVAPGIDLVLNRGALAIHAAGNYRFYDIDQAASPYADIGQVPAGHIVELHGGRISRRPYAGFAERDDEFAGPVETVAAEYRSLIEDAVARRLRRAGRPAFTLSGGLDSSTVVTLAARALGGPQAAFSSVHDGAEYDESDDIRDIIDTGAVDWHPIPVGADGLVELVDRLIALHDEPVPTATWLNHFRLAERARAEGFEALFGGLGGDEQHAGEYDYFIYHFADLLAAGDEAAHAAELAAWQRNHDHPVWRKTPERAALLRSELVDPAHPGRCLANTALNRRYAGLLAPDFFDLEEIRPEHPHAFSSYLKSHTVNELLRSTIPCCLRAGERNLAALGMADIHPFLDHRLFDFMLRVPGRWKIRDGMTKSFARTAYRGLLPEATRTRVVKTGWNAPIHEWFAGPLRDPLLDIIGSQRFRERGIYRPGGIEALVEEHRRIVESGKPQENHMMVLWQVLNVALWLDGLERRSGRAVSFA